MACEEVVCKTVTIKTDATSKSLNEVEKSMDKVGGKTANLSKGMGELPGPLGKAKQGVGALSKAFKALLANPIVLIIAAIVAGLAALFKAFTKTQEGADKMKEATEALSAVIDVITQRAAKLFKALGQIFKGNFKEGFQEMGDAVKGVKDELIGAAQAAVEFERAQRRLYEAETDVITANAERRQQIAELVFLTRDMTQSVETRRDAIIEAGKIEEEILADNIALQQQRLALAKAEADNSAEEIPTRQELRKIAEEEAKLTALQTESLGKQRELKNRLNTLDMEAAAARREIHVQEMADLEERQAKEKEIRDARLAEEKEASELDQQFKEDMAADNLDFQKEIDAQIEKSNKESTDKMMANAQALFDHEDDLARKREENERKVKAVKQQIYQDSLTALIGFLGEGSKLGKAILIADATKSAIQGAIATYSSVSAIPIAGPALAPIAAAAALAAGMANVKKIASTPEPLGGGGASVPSVSLTTPDAAALGPGDLANAEQGIPTDVSIVQDQTATKGATKTYVVQSEVTAEQDIQAKREADVTL